MLLCQRIETEKDRAGEGFRAPLPASEQTEKQINPNSAVQQALNSPKEITQTQLQDALTKEDVKSLDEMLSEIREDKIKKTLLKAGFSTRKALIAEEGAETRVSSKDWDTDEVADA